MSDMNQDVVTAIAALARQGSKPTAHELSGRSFIATPDGVAISDLTDRIRADAKTPRHRSGTTQLLSLESFVSFTRRFAERPRSVLFGNQGENTITAIFDHHDPLNGAVPEPEFAEVGETAPGGEVSVDVTVEAAPAAATTADLAAAGEAAERAAEKLAAALPDDVRDMLRTAAERIVKASFAPKDEGPQPRWGRHRATYAFPVSKAWETWTGKHGRRMTQLELAVFIEENLVDVQPDDGGDLGLRKVIEQTGLIVADPIRLLEMSREFRVNGTEEGGESNVLSTGETQITFKTTVTATDSSGARVTVPTAFVLALPVFEGGALYRLLVRLRTRRQEGKNVFIFDIYRLDRTKETAFQEECEGISARTQVPLFFGVAPSPQTP
jgi:hypothetical protein